MNIEKIAIESLIPYVNNQKIHTQEQIEKIAGSIKEFGFLNPIIVDKDNVIIAGHGRYEGAKKLGLEKVPVLRAEHLTPAQVKAYRIADNRLAELSQWDEDLVKLEIMALEECGYDFDNLGLEFDFDIASIDEVDEVEVELPDGDKTPIRNITFSVSEEQYDKINEALKIAKEYPLFDPMGLNENQNGNALYYIVEFFLNNLNKEQ
jgi:hypothetical protein